MIVLVSLIVSSCFYHFSHGASLYTSPFIHDQLNDFSNILFRDCASCHAMFHFITLTFCPAMVSECKYRLVACMLAPYGGVRSSEGAQASRAPPWIRHLYNIMYDTRHNPQSYIKQMEPTKQCHPHNKKKPQSTQSQNSIIIIISKWITEERTLL